MDTMYVDSETFPFGLYIYFKKEKDFMYVDTKTFPVW